MICGDFRRSKGDGRNMVENFLLRTGLPSSAKLAIALGNWSNMAISSEFPIRQLSTIVTYENAEEKWTIKGFLEVSNAGIFNGLKMVIRICHEWVSYYENVSSRRSL